MASIGANEKHRGSGRAVASSVRADWSLISWHNEGRLTAVYSEARQRERERKSSYHILSLSHTHTHVKGYRTRRTNDIKDSEARLINFLI